MALGVAAAILAFGACADQQAAAPVTLVLKHAKILGPADPVPGLLREFEAAHPGVRVKAEALPWNADEQRQFFAINLEGGNPGFDVMMLDVIWVPEFARAGWLLDLAPAVPREELAAHFPAAVEAAVADGRIWALPWFMNVGLLYYRSDLLARHGLRPPATWDELVRQVGQIRAAERDPALDGFLWQGKQYEGLVVNVLEGLWASGTRLLGSDGALFPDPARAEQVLGFMRMLLDTGTSPAWVSAADEEQGRRAFGNGRAIFLRSWPYAVDLFELPGSAVRGRVGIAPLPRHVDGTASPGSTGGAHLAVQRRTRHPELAIALARFLTSEAAQRAMASGAALNPTRMALYREPDLVRTHPHLPEIAALTLAGRPRPITPFYTIISTTLQPEFSAALVGVKTPARAVADSRRRLAFLLQGLR
ncbi:MAG: ABC transporter substrate-binding protein [Candidatus Rokubacteria bacterium]|nr:ABC transporter substrate-binding protein [Candidatus Rokubacteria bacterium]